MINEHDEQMTQRPTDLYADETACRVRDQFMAGIKRGATPAAAERAVFNRYPDLTSDHRKECAVLFALADTQWRQGCLNPRVQMRALALLLGGGDMAYWVDSSAVDASARATVLATLTMQLLKPSALREISGEGIAPTVDGRVDRAPCETPQADPLPA